MQKKLPKKSKPARQTIRPQPGPQEQFLASEADIVFYGGAAGGGKSFGLLMEPLRHVTTNPEFYTVIFRRNTTQIRNPGGLWDEAMKLYPWAHGRPINHVLEWRWSQGGKIRMAHLEHENSVLDWQGAQIPLICCVPETPVLLANGLFKPLGEVRVGDFVQTLNGAQKITKVGLPEEAECVECIDSSGNRQVHSVEHKVLTQLGWISYEDMLNASPLFRGKVRSKLVYYLCRFVSPYARQFQSLRRLLLGLFSDRKHIFSQEQSPRDLLSLSETSFCTGPVAPDINYGSSGGCTSTQRRLSSNHLSSKLRRLFLASKDLFSFPSKGLGESSCEPLWRLVFGGLKDYYSIYSHLYGERFAPSASSDQGYVLQLNGVVVRTHSGLLSDDPGIAPSSNLKQLHYNHPYTGEELISEEDYSLGTLLITPVGKRKVIHITVDNACHYITALGIINKNCFDELTHFTESQFFYMLSRNRSMCGVRPYIRGTTNPDADSWVARFIAWWINEDGSPVEERSGVVRWFIRLSDTILWADSAEELVRDYGPEVRPKSFTFIRARLEDNPALLKADPGYRANLMALSRVERERLLGGNWKVRPSAGMYFKRHEITLVDSIPDDIVKLVRYWDLAATEPGEDNPDPDWTAGVLMGLRKNGRYIILDVIHCRKKSGSVRELVLRTSGNDTRQVKIGLPQDPGQAGKDQVESYVSLLAGFSVETVRETGDKITRADPFAAQWQNNNVDILRAPWNDGYFDELEAFPSKAHDDRVDASSGAFRMLTGNSIAIWSKLGKK